MNLYELQKERKWVMGMNEEELKKLIESKEIDEYLSIEVDDYSVEDYGDVQYENLQYKELKKENE